jgi:hypothetical protein
MNTQHVCNQTHLKHDKSHDIFSNQVGKDGGIGKMRPVVTGKGKDTTQPVYPWFSVNEQTVLISIEQGEQYIEGSRATNRTWTYIANSEHSANTYIIGLDQTQLYL